MTDRESYVIPPVRCNPNRAGRGPRLIEYLSGSQKPADRGKAGDEPFRR